MRIEALTTIDLGSPSGQLRARPVSLGPGSPEAALVAWCADFDVDPYVEMFYFPTDTLKLAVVTAGGEILWKRDLGKGVVPGMWFCPIQAFDLDGDGVGEVWFVNNVNTEHPLSLRGYRLERVDAVTGETTGQWPWPCGNENQSLGQQFRNFILGGKVRGEPVLVTVQGTYGDMFFQAWRTDMTCRWEKVVRATDPGARGSHMAPVVDLNDDGVDELLWGERCIELDGGRELFCCDRDSYRGHSDIVWPFRDPGTGRYVVFTARESDGDVSPRVVLFDDAGARIWGAVDRGHMDMGWVARRDDERHVAMAIRIGAKTCGPDGRHHLDREEFVFDALTGERLKLPFSVYRTFPVDTGEGHDVFVRGIPGGDAEVINWDGEVIGNVGGTVAMSQGYARRPGDEMLTYEPDGTLRFWAVRP